MTELRVVLVDAELRPDAPMWGDSSDGWQPPAVRWAGLLATLGIPHEVRTSLADAGPGLVIDPAAELPDADGRDVLVGAPPATAEETLQLLAERLGALVVPDLRGILVLRLDDPGAAVKEHLRDWAHPAVADSAWETLWSALDGFGRVSVFCCPGYVTADGDVVESRSVLPGEWSQLDVGVARGLAALECHGYTHMHPDTRAWAEAGDRHDGVHWFRELWPPAVAQEPSIDAQAERLRLWQRAVGRRGTALVAPGEEWGLNTVAAARACGFRLFNSWGVCFLDRDVPTWSVGVGSPYLDEPDPSAFDDCVPQIGYWHDRDMAVHGPQWLPDQLVRWRDCGARRAWSFGDLAAAYEPIEAALIAGEVVVGRRPRAPLRVVRP